MGKPQRRDLGGVDRDRDTLRHFSQPKYVKSQKFSSNPLGSNITRQLALGALRGVNIVSVATDDVLAWDGTAWIATAESGTGGQWTHTASNPASQRNRKHDSYRNFGSSRDIGTCSHLDFGYKYRFSI